MSNVQGPGTMVQGPMTTRIEKIKHEDGKFSIDVRHGDHRLMIYRKGKNEVYEKLHDWLFKTKCDSALRIAMEYKL